MRLRVSLLRENGGLSAPHNLPFSHKTVHRQHGAHTRVHGRHTGRHTGGIPTYKGRLGRRIYHLIHTLREASGCVRETLRTPLGIPQGVY